MRKTYQTLITKIGIFFLALVIVAASFFAGIVFGFENRPGAEKIVNVANKESPSQFQNVDFNLFWEVWTRLEEKYVDAGSISREKLVDGAIAGLVQALGDPYSEYMDAATTKQFNEDIRGSFDGIGAEIGLRRGVLTVISPLKESPAAKAGLKAGDKILQVDDAPTHNLTLNEAVRKIRGKKGETVVLTIFRESAEKAMDITIIRDTITINAVSADTASEKLKGLTSANNSADDRKDIFVITLNHFSQSAAFEFRRAVQEFYKTNSKRLILDLRNNPGGFLQVAVDIASWFLPPGDVVARERFADGSEQIYRSNGYRLLENIPMVILVNEGSASASEIVAGALRDLKGVKIVGTKTFGKGSVQEVEPLPKDASLKITIAKWLTPNGLEIDEIGLMPDVVVEPPEEKDENGGNEKEENEEEERDFIMEKGIEALREL